MAPSAFAVLMKLMAHHLNNQSLKRFRPWFYAAALYNFLWGMLVIFWPALLFDLLGIPQLTDTILWQVVGMFVMLYAPAYWWAARRPETNYHFICIGFLGKLFGPIGFVGAVSTGSLPPSFGLIILFNDIIWWPAFAGYLKTIFKIHGVRPVLCGQ